MKRPTGKTYNPTGGRGPFECVEIVLDLDHGRSTTIRREAPGGADGIMLCCGMEIPTMRTQSRRLRCGLLLLLIPLGPAATWLASDDTVYAPGYSEARFRSVRIGMSRDQVIRALGEPLSIQPAPGYVLWVYAPKDYRNPRPQADGSIRIPPETAFQADQAGKVLSVSGSYPDIGNDEFRGHPLGEVRERFGEPVEVHSAPDRDLYWYSKVDGVKGHYVRIINISNKTVVIDINAGRIGYYTGGEGKRDLGWIEWLEERL